MSLDELRMQIDEIDAGILQLFQKRLDIAREIGSVKKQNTQLVEDLTREKLIIERVRKLAQQEGVPETVMESIYKGIFTLSKSVQGITAAFQGEPGAYSEEAACSFFSPDVRLKPCASFDEVFQAVEDNEVQFGVAPVENSLEGSVFRTYDLLLTTKLRICGEIQHRVTHCLIGMPGARLDSIKRVYSHPQALGQCQSYLRRLGVETVPAYDTAGSVKMVKETGDAGNAAIASARAASLYTMDILAREIEDNPGNYTRFFVLADRDAPPTGQDKTSIVFSVKHQPGSLYQAMKALADRSINLTKIESRPTRKTLWEYNFYADFEGHRNDVQVQDMLEALEEHSLFVKVLGSYPRAH